MTTVAATLDPTTADPTLLLLTVEEAARRLGIGRTTCFALIASGELESVKVGSLRRIPVDALVAYVGRLRGASASSMGDA
ncbi:helix-turn-helix domain-containing protein [Streptomyces glomeratus]|uniref:Helix-turn-helix domain-containing protein n=1 Tax=Streptomyces glomeratus TaxID=284452 RepID=A0ABP6LMK9_9ACTN|nr:helix-turn-helix domain-containing protein [Streptomyces glomeratus]MCF1511870.1 helix-turn-helix domain-containing protein [Streptomyces glomeratus]